MTEHTREPVRFNWTESGMEQSDGGHYVAYPTYCFSLQQRIAALESEVALLNSANEQQRWIIQRLNDAESIVSNELKASQQREGELREALVELVATVRGECPSLLNEDSGGSSHLISQIDKALQGREK